jgi:hypothetical protein
VSTPLRLLSVDARSLGRDRAALSRVITAAGCDVVCVHGGPHLPRWRAITAEVARRAGLVVVTGGRPAGANLLLSTLGVDVAAVQDLRLPGGSRLAAPGAALGALRLRGTDFVLGCATLTGDAPERRAQARKLRAAIDTLVPGDPPPIVSVEGAESPFLDGLIAVADGLFVDARITVGGLDKAEHGVRAELVVSP